MKITELYARPVYTDVYEGFHVVKQDVYTGRAGRKQRVRRIRPRQRIVARTGCAGALEHQNARSSGEFSGIASVRRLKCR
jgi:hypothetical protein